MPVVLVLPVVSVLHLGGLDGFADEALHDELAEGGRERGEVRAEARHAHDEIGMALGVRVGVEDLVRVDDIDVDQRAAEVGNSDGMYNMGFLYTYGYGVAKDLERALNWFTKSAEAGNAHGMFRLGQMYEYGAGLPGNKPSLAQAKEWYRKAYDAADPKEHDYEDFLREVQQQMNQSKFN